MLRLRFLVLFVVVALALSWVKPVVADDIPDPKTCLPTCFVANQVLAGTNTPGSGTAKAPWVISSETDRTKLRTETFVNSVVISGTAASLTAVVCDNAGCAYTVYNYDATGKITAGEPKPGIPPEIGVPLPFPYLLGGGLVLGAVLIGTGVVLRRRVRR